MISPEQFQTFLDYLNIAYIALGKSIDAASSITAISMANVLNELDKLQSGMNYTRVITAMDNDVRLNYGPVETFIVDYDIAVPENLVSIFAQDNVTVPPANIVPNG